MCLRLRSEDDVRLFFKNWNCERCYRFDREVKPSGRVIEGENIEPPRIMVGILLFKLSTGMRRRFRLQEMRVHQSFMPSVVVLIVGMGQRRRQQREKHCEYAYASDCSLQVSESTCVGQAHIGSGLVEHHTRTKEKSFSEFLFRVFNEFSEIQR